MKFRGTNSNYSCWGVQLVVSENANNQISRTFATPWVKTNSTVLLLWENSYFISNRKKNSIREKLRATWTQSLWILRGVGRLESDWRKTKAFTGKTESCPDINLKNKFQLLSQEVLFKTKFPCQDSRLYRQIYLPSLKNPFLTLRISVMWFSNNYKSNSPKNPKQKWRNG